MRLAAKKLYDYAKDAYSNETVQDIVETSLKQSAIAAGMAGLTDMTPEEIVLASLIGGSAAMAARPLGKRLGRRVGRALDSVDDGPSALAKINEYLDRGMSPNNPSAIKEGADLLKRRFINNYSRPDGSIAGDYEGMLGEIVRESADDATQLGLGLLLPGLFAREQSTDQTSSSN